MKGDIYLQLAQHLDRLPEGFPPSQTGADQRLLKLLFTPEEAEIGVHLTLDREGAGVIAAKAELPTKDAEKHLQKMAEKGLILSYLDEYGVCTYQAVPFVVGIYEFQVNNLSEELLDALHDYWNTAENRQEPETIPQMRTIPIGQSIDARVKTMTYEQVNALVDAHTHFAVAPCICRRHAKLRGEGCNAPEESCLIFGDWAEYYTRTGRGREIDRDEMMALIARADAANLVLQPSNSQQASFICCCCGCCCGVLAGLKHHPRPADAVANAFIATFTPEICEGCFTCLKRCQMDALVEDGERVALISERCIGCGLCVSTCPTGALTLTRKPETELTNIPPTMDITWKIMSQARTQ